jgi:hypothetical protein
MEKDKEEAENEICGSILFRDRKYGKSSGMDLWGDRFRRENFGKYQF